MSPRIHSFDPWKFEKLDGKDAMSVLKEASGGLKNGWWLSAGTLLGFYRDGGFIPHDTDIDVAVIGRQDMSYLPETYRPIRVVTDKDGRRYQSAYIHDPTNIIFDCLHYWPHPEKEGVFYTESEKGFLYRDKNMIENIVMHDFGELGEWPVPRETEKYLEIWYGTWQIPVEKSKTKWER